MGHVRTTSPFRRSASDQAGSPQVVLLLLGPLLGPIEARQRRPRTRPRTALGPSEASDGRETAGCCLGHSWHPLLPTKQRLGASGETSSAEPRSRPDYARSPTPAAVSSSPRHIPIRCRTQRPVGSESAIDGATSAGNRCTPMAFGSGGILRTSFTPASDPGEGRIHHVSE